MSLDISQIRRDGGTQSRAKIDEATVADFVHAMSDKDNIFPPVEVYYDGTNYWLADGFHRLEAWERIGRTTKLPVNIRPGDRRRAILHSLKANTTHGLRRSNEDKRHSVQMLLDDEEWSQWSNREIAKACAVSDHLVGEMRGLTAFSRSEDPNEVRTYTTRHGITAKMRVKKLGAVKKDGASKHPDEAIHDVSSIAVVKASASPTTDSDALAQLTREALEVELVGLRGELAEAMAQIDAQMTEIERLKAQGKRAGTLMCGLANERDQEKLEKLKAVEEQQRLQVENDGLMRRIKELKETHR